MMTIFSTWILPIILCPLALGIVWLVRKCFTAESSLIVFFVFGMASLIFCFSFFLETLGLLWNTLLLSPVWVALIINCIGFFNGGKKWIHDGEINLINIFLVIGVLMYLTIYAMGGWFWLSGLDLTPLGWLYLFFGTWFVSLFCIAVRWLARLFNFKIKARSVGLTLLIIIFLCLLVIALIKWRQSNYTALEAAQYFFSKACCKEIDLKGVVFSEIPSFDSNKKTDSNYKLFEVKKGDIVFYEIGVAKDGRGWHPVWQNGSCLMKPKPDFYRHRGR